jgi:SAM-dependent methyltransferase
MISLPDFSVLAREYAQYRPTYPDELFRYLASIAPGQRLALDCATGNGQAARGLVDSFQAVYSFDISLSQIKHAFSHPNVSYFAARAEAIPLEKGRFDLVVVTQALHWFDLPAFYGEVRRLLRPGGILAAAAYSFFETDPAVEQIIHRYYFQVLDAYWSPGIRLLERKYQTIPFPFQEKQPPEFTMETAWNLYELLGFLASWSAIPPFIEEKGYHPLQEVKSDLLAAWGEPEGRKILRWPVYLKVGVVE